MIKSYQIKKIMVKNGKPQHVILLDPNGEVYETSCFGEVTKLCELLKKTLVNKTRGFSKSIDILEFLA